MTQCIVGRFTGGSSFPRKRSYPVMAGEFETLKSYKIENLNVLPKELDFDVIEFGTDGDLEVVAKKREGINPPSTLPANLPDIFPDTRDELESFLLHPEKLQIHDLHKEQQFWERDKDPETLFRHETSCNKYFLQMEKDVKTGAFTGYKEISLSDVGLTARNSMSFNRQPGSLFGSVKGEPSNYPFMPGGFSFETITDSLSEVKEEVFALEGDLLDTPPGFLEPIKFDVAQKPETTSPMVAAPANSIFNINDIFSGDLALENLDLESNQEDDSPQETRQAAEGHNVADSEEVDEEVLQVEVTAPQKPEMKKTQEWAIIENVEHGVDDFHRLVPDMAHKFSFELDNFQKQAVLHLERHECVLVAAHTSAGKTVVAEYAIALAQKHMTKAIYTSPIKALSNQKFRDFKDTFTDVGILTGDVQIRPEASCLVMTTEILRSMLYNGSDVIRDIEWVIFDEIHYINDASRGVVWEEVLIMLPEQVGIVLLSATVPNTYEFADWIGRTKQKKIYVISTYKRPVPLEHNLYTGNSTKTMKELFLLVDSHGKFDKRGYQAAIDALKSRTKKSKEAYGSKSIKTGNPKQDRSNWQAVIEMLKQKSQLPVVAFTFSRKMCDNNANQLTFVDLTTSAEKSRIHVFIKKCVSRLKGSDRQLPQVAWIGNLLNRGIGVHHRGMLPILKEMVEMLFQKGLVKLLFATETFAMGVNMPARTVIFDSIQKHDGQCKRDLLPSEYIQMAGRAGRRGLDSTGLVIILCKNGVPDSADLHKMMMGKPTHLQSRFRLTYSMILNLLQVEQLTMEDMMKRSFAEFSHQKETPIFAERKEALEKETNTQNELECPICAQDLRQYYSEWKEFCHLSRQLQSFILGSQAGMRALAPGRVVLVSNDRFHNALAIVLQQSDLRQRKEISKDPLDKLFTVFVLASKEDAPADRKCDLQPTAKDTERNPIISRQLATLVGAASQIVEEIRGSDIKYITTKQIKTDPTRVIEDHKKRQIPRFRDDPPSETTATAAQELLRLMDSNPNGISYMEEIKDFNMKYLDVAEKVKRVNQIEETINLLNCVQCPQFLDHFSQVRNEMVLKDELQRVKYLLSNESLELLPEYQQRMEVLKSLRYTKKDRILALKGRVARTISNNELMITELVFDNQLTHLKPPEIVALLSCFVCEEKRCSEPELTETLRKGVDVIKHYAKTLARIQIDCGMSLTEGEFVETFRFGLVQVVYEWARGMPFKEITELTDIPEGIIVRCIQRLDEICRDVKGAAGIIGDPLLVDKMQQGSSLIKRDIVFAGSLYTS